MNIIFFGDSLTEGVPGAAYFDILKERLPQHNLINCGKGGDTVISLYRRMKKMDLSQAYDIAFLWIGTNDILVHVSKKYPIIKLCCMQPWAKDVDDFKKYYQKNLEMIASKTNKIFVVSPALIGEDASNKWNEQLGELSVEIEKLSAGFENAEYIDVRKEFISKLSSKKPSNFILNSISRDVIVAWFLNDPERVERKSKERGLYLTYDGAHLNQAGAQFVADIFLRCIENEL